MNDTTRKTLTYLLGATMLLVFAGFSYSKFTSALTPYVSYEKAIESERAVQVAGGLEQGSSMYDDTEGLLRFTLVDPERPGETMRVRYEGLKPANFEDAISIVAIGQYDAGAEEFAANDLLVKCPSKYQGVEEYDEKSYGSESAPSVEPAMMTTNTAASSG
ncbi:MAG: cytochrome c maturation protein CcmE [Acidobacteriota bacterium]